MRDIDHGALIAAESLKEETRLGRNSIVGGFKNIIGFNDNRNIGNFIGGGEINQIDDGGAATSHSLIGGGQNNCICAGTNHSSIFGGNRNMVSGSFSSILGGSSNCDNGLDYVGIFGQNVTGVMNNAFHANNFVAQNMCSAAGGSGPFATGTLYFDPTTCVVYWNP